MQYTYPDSADEDASVKATGEPKPIPLSQRLRSLQAELASLENEIADPSNPLLAKEREESNLDPGELLRGLVDVRSRLEKIVKEKEGRARLVDNILHDDDESQEKPKAEEEHHAKVEQTKTVVASMVDVDRRVEALEKLIGSSNATLDDVRAILALSTSSLLTTRRPHPSRRPFFLWSPS